MQRSQYYSEKDFIRVPKIDAHVHMNTSYPYFGRIAQKNNFRLLSINTEVPEYPELPRQQEIICEQQRHFPESIFCLTSFDTKEMDHADWPAKALRYIKSSIEKGALGVKVWKNIGMDLKREDGSFVMICDAEFEPVFEYLQAEDIPVLGHIGEPRNCWLPLSEMTVNNDKNYYAGHPEFHMYLHPEFPSYTELVGSRDRLLEKFPDLRFVGAHLGSMEWNVDEVAQRLEKYPNFYVDLTDRICHLQYQGLQDHKKVMDFIYSYQDRIIYGTDLEYFDVHNKEEVFQHSADTWKRDWMYFTTDQKLKVPALDTEVPGIKLESPVIDKIFRLNAENCYFKN